ncbi:MAG: phytanoyl-CoA dioxygenase family protein [Pseudomonadota bacterium]
MANAAALWKTPPRGHFRYVANLLGLQVARVLWFEVQFRIRKLLIRSRFPKSDATRIVEKNGYIVIENFFDPSDFDRLKSYYYEQIAQAPKPDQAGPKLAAPTVSNPRNGEVDPIIEDLFVQNNRINEIIENCSAHRQNIKPLIRLHHYWIEPEEMGTREVARTDELHYDVPMNNMRGFFFVEDCDRTNAAFEIAPATHSFGLKRLYMEYVDSLVQAKAREGKPEAKVQPISEKLQKLIKANPIPLEAKANSLVIFNTMCLHRRGRFSAPGTREAILLDYRYLDSLANYRYYKRPAKWLMRASG